MEHTEEYFTLATLGKLYTDAAKASGIEALIMGGWHDSNGPHLLSKVANYRLKPAPVVRYMIKYPDGKTSQISFTSEANAERYATVTDGKVIKLTEEVS